MEFDFKGTQLKIYENGEMFRWIGGDWRFVDTIESNGYLVIRINYKMYLQHRIIGLLFLGLDIDDNTSQIDHIDRNKSNNSINNLRIVTPQQNLFNKNVKGYYITKYGFTAQLVINGIKYRTLFKTEAEVIKWREMMKSAFHIIE